MEIRTYTKQELAQLYFPDAANGENAMKVLNKWIKLNIELRNELCATHYSKWSRSFTPRQVAILTRYLGEP